MRWLFEDRTSDARSGCGLRCAERIFLLVLGKTVSRGCWTRTNGHDWAAGVELAR